MCSDQTSENILTKNQYWHANPEIRTKGFIYIYISVKYCAEVSTPYSTG